MSAMTPEEKKRLEAAGYTVGDTQQFLGLTDEEMKLIDLRIALVRAAKAARKKAGLTQADIAKRIGSSQPRVAAVERFGTEPSLDLVIRCLYAAGGDLPGPARDARHSNPAFIDSRFRLAQWSGRSAMVTVELPRPIV